MLPGEALKGPEQTGAGTAGEDARRDGLEQAVDRGLGLGEVGLNDREEQLWCGLRVSRKVAFM